MGGIVKQSFSVNLQIMRFLGFYPPKKHQILYKLHAFFLYCVLLILTSTLGVFFMILKENIDIVQIADNAFLLSELLCFIVKYFPFIIRGTEIQRCIHYFDSPFFKVLSIRQEKIVEDCSRTCKNINAIFLVCVTGSVMSWAVKPLFLKEYKLPVDIWLPFEATIEAHIYYSVYGFLVVGVSYCAYASAAIDPLIAGLASHAAGQIRVLKDNLQFLHDYVNEEVSQHVHIQSEETLLRSRIMYNKIKNCVDHHNAILDFVKFYEKCFSLSVFSQFFGSVFVICITCLQLSLVNPLSFNFLSLLIYLSTMLSEIFLYCYYGSILIDESNSLTGAIYMGEWYNYDVKSRKELIILMERSKRPMVVTAGKILDLSLVTFTTILRRSYSLLAVLKNY